MRIKTGRETVLLICLWATTLITANACGAVEGTEHDDDASILAKMSNGLRSTACQVEVGGRVWPQDHQRIESFG